VREGVEGMDVEDIWIKAKDVGDVVNDDGSGEYSLPIPDPVGA
jgi:hypothetical protein